MNDKRERLYDRIERRVDIMVENGLVEEVSRLRAIGLGRDLVSMQGIGYKEIYAYLDGEISLEKAVDDIKKNTRHFAKRQLTWLRHEDSVIFINKDEFEYDDDRIVDFMVNGVNL